MLGGKSKVSLQKSSSINVGKYKSLTSADVLPENYLLWKAAAIKRVEYSRLGSEFKKQTDIAKNNIKDR